MRTSCSQHHVLVERHRHGCNCCQWHIRVFLLHIEDNCPDWDPLYGDNNVPVGDPCGTVTFTETIIQGNAPATSRFCALGTPRMVRATRVLTPRITVEDNQGPDFGATSAHVSITCDDINYPFGTAIEYGAPLGHSASAGAQSILNVAGENINAGKTMLELFDCSNVSVTFTQTFQSGGCENPGDIVRVYTAIDDCGNESTFEQFISVVDNEGPEVEAPDHTVDCGAYSSDDLYPIGVADCALNDWTLERGNHWFVGSHPKFNWGSLSNGAAELGRNHVE